MRVIEALAALCAAGQHPWSEEFPQVSTHHAAVRDDDDARALGVAGADRRDGLPEPRDNFLVGFRPDERPAFLLGDGEKFSCQLGVSLFLLRPGVTFEEAPAPLAQAFYGDDLPCEARALADDLCGFEGAGERAGVQAVEGLSGEAEAREAGLRPPSSERGNSIWPCQMPLAFAVDCP